VDYTHCTTRPPLEGAVGADRLCGGDAGAAAVAVVLLRDGDADVAARAYIRSWQELHPSPQWRVEVVTEAGARARVLQSLSPALPPVLVSLLRDGRRWGQRFRDDPEGARMALGLGVLLAMRGVLGEARGGDGGMEVGVVVAGVPAVSRQRPPLERSVDCMLRDAGAEVTAGEAVLFVVDGDGGHVEEEEEEEEDGEGGIASLADLVRVQQGRNAGAMVVLRDWARVQTWVEEWAAARDGGQNA
jgi:hypothetical protein